MICRLQVAVNIYRYWIDRRPGLAFVEQIRDEPRIGFERAN
jgi:hypothetical protein